MRKPIIAGNWKMNLLPSEGAALVKELLPLVEDAKCDVVVCPPFVDLPAVYDVIKGTNIHLGAQNLNDQPKGAFTGEVSADMLKAVGVEYVIIGHSERRAYNNETDESVNKKAAFALSNGLTPIICVGESLEERQSEKTNEIICAQTVKALEGLSCEDVIRCVIAYEPIWAIGTGLTASNEQANEAIGTIRSAICDAHGEEAASKIRIQYGGSMNAKNCEGLMAQSEIDGGLIGGASLKAPDFSVIVKAASNTVE